jgi:endonuclease I
MLIAFLMSCSILTAQAQLYPGLEGEPLTEAIRSDYTPSQLLNDTQVKDTLYARVFAVNDTVKCMYSDLARYLPSGVDPSQWLFGSGSEVESINLEHGWPQAKGAGKGTRGNRDMHHLFPSRTKINGDRANFPFGEIDDDQTQKWYFLGQEMSGKPVNNINAYSEFLTGAFEPRESMKGDIARALFYFWTIYREDAMVADPFFFDLQQEYLCQWHDLDPVDEFEALRNERIASYQDGKLNPFILDCSLVGRAYCNMLTECEIVSTPLIRSDTGHIRFWPSLQQITIEGEPGLWHVKVMDVLGHIIQSIDMDQGEASGSLSVPTGFFIAYGVNNNKVLVQTFFNPQ